MKCTVCKIDYPDGYLNPLVTSEGTPGLMCGVCALETVNRLTGVKRDRFNGEMAEENRQKAIRFRRKRNAAQ